jgi:chemotaxis signal transduction protein
MARFDAPHKRIHNLAVQAQELIKAGQKQQAKDMIHDAERRELTALIALFDNAERTIRSFTYEYAVIIENSGSKFAISVDAVKSFEQFDEIILDIPPMLKRTCGDFLQAFARRSINGKAEDVLILDVEKIIKPQALHAS